MKKGIKTKLGLSVASLALVAAALSTSTYAWFTTNASASTEELNVSAEAASDSIYMSTDGVNFGKTIDIDTESIKLTAVTYDKEGKKYVDLKDAAAAETAYLSFSIYFKTTATSANQIVFDLTNEKAKTSFVTQADTISEFTLLADLNETNMAGTKVKSKITSATRLAVTPYTSQELVKVAEDTEWAAGARKAYLTTEEAAEGFIDLGDITKVDGAVKYYNTVMGDTLVNPYAGEETPLTENEAGNATAITDGTSVCASIKAGEIGKVDFVYYIEGWDADAFDSILGQTVDMILAFKLAAVSA